MALWTFDSSSIRGIEYDKESRVLSVHFMSGEGSIWEYLDVPPEVNQAFRDTPSAGKFYAREVKGLFAGRKVEHSASEN